MREVREHKQSTSLFFRATTGSLVVSTVAYSPHFHALGWNAEQFVAADYFKLCPANAEQHSASD